MKDEHEPVSDDEYLLRRIPKSNHNAACPEDPFKYESFRPTDYDDDGISLFREACGATPQEVAVGNNPKGYYVVRLNAGDIRALKDAVGLSTLTIDPTPTSPGPKGHISIQEMNTRARSDPKVRDLIERLRSMAKNAIVHSPP